MKRIGLLSDTHGFIDNKILNFFSKCDEIWHAGDIGNIETADKISLFKPLKAVYGNIDGIDVRAVYSKFQQFTCENVDVLITHIGGYPGKYEKEVVELFKIKVPKLFISGHSHILKVIFDKKYNLLHINPGAAGKSGMHTKQTAVRFVIDGSEIKDLEIWELERH
ncbi:MAG: YfcE family phosphodiesterase [Bacteroidetes bacterium GWF2_33_16]|nr:MAG: YfcE family phosphodiesterase [Bacteroidetes bacterium GWE2_32_14]OFY07291.1 MAG: YfcE family phosphodiesterase [Bacteroidetes bacterium GWF2_33_16]